MKKLFVSLAWLALVVGCATNRLPETSLNPFIDFSAAELCVWLRDDMSPVMRFLTATTVATLLLKEGI